MGSIIMHVNLRVYHQCIGDRDIKKSGITYNLWFKKLHCNRLIMSLHDKYYKKKNMA